MGSREQLFIKFGETAEAAQLFETALGTVVLAAMGHNRNWFEEQRPEETGVALERIERSTLGQILGLLKSELIIGDGSIVAQFERGLRARNKLFHGFFERHNFRIQTDEGRDAMILDLETLHEELFRCWRVAEGVAHALVEGEILSNAHSE